MIHKILILIVGILISFSLATWLIRWGIPKLGHGKEDAIPLPESSPTLKIFDYLSAGFWIGFLETILIFVVVYEREYSALAIIFAAKQFLPKEMIRENPAYYRLGSLINITIALLIAIVARSLIMLKT